MAFLAERKSIDQRGSGWAVAFTAHLAATHPEAIMVIDAKGQICDASPPLCRLLGTERTTLIGQHADTLLEAYNRQLFTHLQTQARRRPGEAVISEAMVRGVVAPLTLVRYTFVALPDPGAPLIIATIHPLQHVAQLTRDVALLNEDLSEANGQIEHSLRELAQERAHLDMLHRLSRTLNQSLDLDQVLGDALFSAMVSFGAQAAGLLLLDERGSALAWASSDNAQPPPQVLLGLALEIGPQGQALRERRVQRIDDYDREFAGLTPLLAGRSLLIAPLLSDSTTGLLTLAHAMPHFFGAHQEAVLETVAETSALAIRNAQLYTRLREAEAARERMTNLLVHDIRSPLMATHAGIEIAQRFYEGQASPIVTEALEAGLRSLQGVVVLTNDLLDIKKIQAGRYDLDRRPTSVDQLYETVCGQLQALALKQGVTLRHRTAPRWLEITADARLLGRVLTNLVANALRFTPASGTVALSARLVNVGDDLLLTVEDTGPGVPAAERERIFQPFAQGVGEESHGSGLGLAFCREVVLAHGGAIWVDDRYGGGSCFCISLPTRSTV